jgi:hypothetical protein
MYRKQSRYKGAWPECLCHPAKHKKKEDGIHHVEEKICQVKALGIEAEDLIVKQP